MSLSNGCNLLVVTEVSLWSLRLVELVLCHGWLTSPSLEAVHTDCAESSHSDGIGA